MSRSIKDKKGQNTAEFAILIALVIGVAVAMQTYVKRGVQARVQGASDKFYDGIATEAGWTGISDTVVTTLGSKQYEPEGFSSKSTQETLVDEAIYTMAEGGTTDREITQETRQADGDYQQQDY